MDPFVLLVKSDKDADRLKLHINLVVPLADHSVDVLGLGGILKPLELSLDPDFVPVADSTDVQRLKVLRHFRITHPECHFSVLRAAEILILTRRQLITSLQIRLPNLLPYLRRPVLTPLRPVSLPA